MTDEYQGQESKDQAADAKRYVEHCDAESGGADEEIVKKVCPGGDL